MRSPPTPRLFVYILICWLISSFDFLSFFPWIHMGLFKIKGEVYKPVKDVDLGPNSREFYLRANVKGLTQSHHLFLFFLLDEFLCSLPMFEVLRFVVFCWIDFFPLFLVCFSRKKMNVVSFFSQIYLLANVEGLKSIRFFLFFFFDLSFWQEFACLASKKNWGWEIWRIFFLFFYF